MHAFPLPLTEGMRSCLIYLQMQAYIPSALDCGHEELFHIPAT